MRVLSRGCACVSVPPCTSGCVLSPGVCASSMVAHSSFRMFVMLSVCDLLLQFARASAMCPAPLLIGALTIFEQHRSSRSGAHKAVAPTWQATKQQRQQSLRRPESGQREQATQAQVCPHCRHESCCKECPGSLICPHGMHPRCCNECRGKEICPYACGSIAVGSTRDHPMCTWQAIAYLSQVYGLPHVHTQQVKD